VDNTNIEDLSNHNSNKPAIRTMENDLHSLKSGASPKDILKDFTKVPGNLPVGSPKPPSAKIPPVAKPPEPPVSSSSIPSGRSEAAGKSFPQQIFKPVKPSVSGVSAPVSPGENKSQPIVKKESIKPFPDNIPDIKTERPAFRSRPYIRAGETQILPPGARLAVQSLAADFGSENKAADSGLSPNASLSSAGSYKFSDQGRIGRGSGFGKILKCVLAAVAIAIAFYGTYYFMKPKNNLPAVTEYPVPAPLITGIGQNIFTVFPAGSGFDLSSSIKEYFRNINNNTTAGVSRLAIKTKSNNEIKVLSISDLESLLKVSFPSPVLNSLDKDYNLISFNYPAKNYLRLGLVFKINDPNALLQQLFLWEPSMFKDTEPLFLGSLILNSSAAGFKSNNYNGASIRYLPLGPDNAALNYATDKNKNFFLIATSKNDIFSLIDSVNR